MRCTSHLCDDRGVTAVEYGLIVVLVVLASAVGIAAAGGAMGGFFGNVTSNLAISSQTVEPSPSPTQSTQSASPSPSPTPTPTPTPTPSPQVLTGSVVKNQSVTTDVLVGLPAGATLDATSVTITSIPNGSKGQAVSATGGSIAFTAPTNKTGTAVITFSYTVNGVTVTGSTWTVTIT